MAQMIMEKMYKLILWSYLIYMVTAIDLKSLSKRQTSYCRGDQIMRSISCKNAMEDLRNEYRDTLSTLQEVLAKTIDEVNNAAEKQLNPLCSKLSLDNPLIRPEDVEKCVLSQWSEWSKPLGFGKIQRTRTILKQGCGCPDETELKQTVDISKYSVKINSSVDEQFQNGFLTNGSNPNKPRDILIILDSSGSILDEDFEFMKEGLKAMIDLFCGGFGYAASNNRLAIIQFATNVTVIHKFSDSQDPASLKQKVTGIRHYAGNTCTGNATKVAADEVFVPENGMRENTVKDTLLVTDGQSNCGLDLRYTVARWLQPKTNVWALGIGLKSSPSARREVESVVTGEDDKHIFSLAKFGDFKQMIQNIKSRSSADLCQPIEFKK